jgi:hypothetical protein
MPEPTGPLRPTLVDPTRTRRRVLLAAIPVVLVALLVTTYLLLPGLLVRRAAAALGVSISWDGLDVGADTIGLRGARVTFAGVDELTVRIDRLRVARRGFDATSFDAEKVTVAVEGSATDRVLELTAWAGEHDDAYRLPGTASEVQVAWRAGTDEDPWLTLTGGSAKLDGKTGRLTGNAAVGGVPLGQVVTSFAADAGGVTIEMGKGATGDAPITARLSTKERPPRLDLTLRPVKLSSLGSALGMALPAPGATASGRAELKLGKRGSTEQITGSASLLLEGYTPPHPREMNGVMAGKKTSVTTRLAVAADRTHVTLSETVVRAGRLELKGGGNISRLRNHAVAHLDVAGPISCADLVRSASSGMPLGDLFGDVAGSAVQGSVQVNVSVDADSRDLRAAKVTPKIAVGCGLKLPGL